MKRFRHRIRSKGGSPARNVGIGSRCRSRKRTEVPEIGREFPPVAGWWKWVSRTSGPVSRNAKVANRPAVARRVSRRRDRLPRCGTIRSTRCSCSAIASENGSSPVLHGTLRTRTGRSQPRGGERTGPGESNSGARRGRTTSRARPTRPRGLAGSLGSDVTAAEVRVRHRHAACGHPPCRPPRASASGPSDAGSRPSAPEPQLPRRRGHRAPLRRSARRDPPQPARAARPGRGRAGCPPRPGSAGAKPGRSGSAGRRPHLSVGTRGCRRPAWRAARRATPARRPGTASRMIRLLRCSGHSPAPVSRWRSTTGTTRPR